MHGDVSCTGICSFSAKNLLHASIRPSYHILLHYLYLLDPTVNLSHEIASSQLNNVDAIVLGRAFLAIFQ